MTDLRGDSMTGEQFVFEERAADPASSVEGERWLRTDLNSGDKLATLRVDVGGSTLDVPVFPTGTSEDGVTEALRVRVGAQTGYIPAIADTSTAGFPQLRLQHDGQVYGYHNEQGVFAFFDVAISSTNSPVDEGSDLNVDYSVVNTGFSANNTQDIRLNIDSTEEDRDTNITLSPSSSTTGTLTWTTPSSSAGTYNASVLSDDDTASTSVTVEAGPAIPDSAIHRWKFDEGSGSTAADSIGSADGSISGATWDSGTWIGNYALSGDGIDDYVDTTTWGSFGSNRGGSWSIIFTMQTTAAERGLIGNEDSTSRLEIFMDGSYGGTADRVNMIVRDTDENTNGIQTASNWTDGNKHRVCINIPNGTDISTWEIWVDATDDTGSITDNQGINGYDDWNDPVQFFRRGTDGADHWTGTLDEIIVCDSDLTSSEIQNDYDRQPWS